ncbi:hypothetical protein LCGC14_0789970 [marine sediment metagenome]|uniref:Uncharacterized protein n=1 Tax=marine sediment metagenome TaxID=412755 RepID=A0A0F9QCR4_9ZZZZ
MTRYRRWPSYQAWRRGAILPTLEAEVRRVLRAEFWAAVEASPPLYMELDEWHRTINQVLRGEP